MMIEEMLSKKDFVMDKTNEIWEIEIARREDFEEYFFHRINL